MSKHYFQVGEYAVERHIVRFVEAELRQYARRKRTLRRLETEICEYTPPNDLGIPRPPGYGDPTFNKALSLMENQERATLKLWLDTVDSTLEQLPPEQGQIVRELYLGSPLTPAVVAERAGMHLATMYRHRAQALLAFVIVLVGSHAVKHVRTLERV